MWIKWLRFEFSRHTVVELRIYFNIWNAAKTNPDFVRSVTFRMKMWIGSQFEYNAFLVEYCVTLLFTKRRPTSENIFYDDTLPCFDAILFAANVLAHSVHYSSSRGHWLRTREESRQGHFRRYTHFGFVGGGSFGRHWSVRGSDPSPTIQIAFLSNRNSSDASKWGMHYGAVERDSKESWHNSTMPIFRIAFDDYPTPPFAGCQKYESAVAECNRIRIGEGVPAPGP